MRTIILSTLVHRRRHRRTARQQKARRLAARLAWGVLAGFLLSLVVGIGALAVGYIYLTHDLPSVTSLPSFFAPGEGAFFSPTRLYDRTGKQLLLTLENPGIPRRYLHVDPAAPDAFSPELVRTAVSLLDPGFWNHPGFLIHRLLDPQPGTIAERLSLDLFLSQEPPDTRRALRMRLLAAELTSRYGRAQVLEWYLNAAFFGHLTYGAEAASRLYLDKSASELNLAEAALLVPLTDTPALNPLDSPTAALENQRAALQRLQESGQISQTEYERAIQTSLRLTRAAPSSQPVAGAFTVLVLEQLGAQLGRQRLERGGLRIITTLDYPTQLELTCLVRTQLNRLEGTSSSETLPDGSPCQSARLLPTLPAGISFPSGLAASGLLLDNETGQILAFVGDTSKNREIATLTAHAPGTTLTPLVAVAAFARGFSPASLVWDIPASVPEPFSTFTNPDGQFHGPVRLRMALANDYLTPLARIATQIGAENIWRLAGTLGISSLSEVQKLDTLIEGGKVTLPELAHSYSVFANQGNRVGQLVENRQGMQPTSVLYVEDSAGNLLLDQSHPQTQPALSAPLAYLVHHVLSDEQARWPTLGYPNPLEVGRPAGAKTGRTASGQDAWAIGYIAQRTAVFWLGLPAGTQSESLHLDPRYAAGMWHALIQFTARDLPPRDWPTPPEITTLQVCDPSGQLPTPACPTVVSEVFISGNEPTAYDSLYHTYQINRETGRLATVFTPASLIDERVYMAVPPEAQAWARQAGIEIPPSAYDTIQPPQPSPYVRFSSPAPFSYVRGKVSLHGTASGDGFAYYRVQAGAGLNPQSWLQIGPDNSTPVEDGLLAEWDTRGLDGLYALRLIVVRADQTLENDTIQVTVDNTPPLVRILYPLNGQTISSGDHREMIFRAEASDAMGVQRIDWLVDGQMVGNSLVEPFSLAWSATPGNHTLLVRAYDLAGNMTESTPVSFTVQR
ncbi:membrane carboxypeptidase [Anaerolinea thermolimosa]|uniref:transglycosylase domain-containing protein n=1 Tax=Anaerolinea thermolimosa TaxID=229919 RepID=UPI000781C8B0|nr:transglycosylase domain-containing protein [Anaerolinea thermolimosa]GAP07719.1 membrane carboxypeptidase [Anaerolinea thermolimosa]